MIPSQKGIGIRKGATGRLDAGQQILPQGQVAPGNDYLSAGEFVDRPLLDRINPFTPFGSKKFVPSAHGQNLIDHYEKKTGKNVRVLPNEQSVVEHALRTVNFTPGGYFKSKPIIGGGKDPFGRDIYLKEDNPSLFAGAHELGHAFDPDITFKPSYSANNPQTRAEAIEQYQKQTLDTYKKELVAQKAAKDYYDKAGLSDAFSEESLVSYPRDYIDRFINDIAYHELNHQYPNPDTTPYSAAKEYNQKLLDDKDYQRAKGNLLMKAAVMADNVFNPTN